MSWAGSRAGSSARVAPGAEKAERLRPFAVAGRERLSREVPRAAAGLRKMASSAESKTLPDLVKESKARRASLLAENERRRKAAADAAGAASTAAMDSVNVGVSTVWHNQQQLELEARTLQEQAKRFAKQSGQWLATHQAFHSSLKALGDVENWARSLESYAARRSGLRALRAQASRAPCAQANEPRLRPRQGHGVCQLVARGGGAAARGARGRAAAAAAQD